jgi:hypothetical protein
VLPPSDSGLKLPCGGDCLVLVGAADAVELDGAEGGSVELDRLAAPPHGELGRDPDGLHCATR